MSTERRLRIKDIPEAERPYERLEKYGAQALSNAELLAIIIKTGTKEETSLGVSQRLLKLDEEGQGLGFLNDIALEELQSIKGIGKVKAIQIKAIVEFSKRMSANRRNTRVVITSPEDVSNLVMQEMRCLKQEELRVLVLNSKNVVLKTHTAAIGGLNTSAVEAREVFKEAIRSGAAGIVLVHNHPSGDPQPSNEDIKFTKKIEEGAHMLGIRMIDHLIIGDGVFMSLKQKNLI
ncbi:MAG: RadC family protein [Deltaproteobacteria bacterium]